MKHIPKELKVLKKLLEKEFSLLNLEYQESERTYYEPKRISKNKFYLKDITNNRNSWFSVDDNYNDSIIYKLYSYESEFSNLVVIRTVDRNEFINQVREELYKNYFVTGVVIKENEQLTLF